jgi:predicted dinucleotide-binding enzyme
MTTIAVLGAGSVGQALAERLIQAGEQVCFGVRDPGKLAGKGGAATAAVPALRPSAAVAGAKFILVAVPAEAAVAAVRSASDLRGKIVVDCTNPLRWDGGPIWAPPKEGSVAQALAAALPGVAVIKGFNHFGAEIQRQPALAGGAAEAFFAGDDHEAKRAVLDLAARMGFRAHDAGPLRNAGLLENLAVLWIQLASSGGLGRRFGFRIEEQTAGGEP